MWIDYMNVFGRSNDFMNVLNPKSGCVDFQWKDRNLIQTESFTERFQ